MALNKLGLSVLALSLSAAPLVHAQTAALVSPEVQYRIIRQEAAKDPLIQGWLEDLQNSAIKHGLDRGVDVNLRTNPIADQFYRPAMAQVQELIYQYRIEQLHNSALASGSQYQKLLALVKDIATKLQFPAEAIENIHLWVSGANTVNAYTYSGTTKVIDVAIYQGLLDLVETDPGALRQILGHELGHIKSGHIRNRFLLLAIFNAYAQDLIPDPDVLGKEQQEKHDQRQPTPGKGTEKKLLVENEIFRQAKLLVGGEPLSQELLAKMRAHASTEVLLHADEANAAMATKVVARIEDVSDLIREKTTAAQRKELTLSLVDNILGFGKEAPKEGAAAPEPRQPDMKELKDFMAKMDGVLSRSQEISADRWGFLATNNIQDSIMAYVRMTGGKGATVEGMLAQDKELDEMLLHNPDAMLEDGSHPVLGERVRQFETFEKTPGYLIYANPFTQALYEYLSLSQMIAKNDQIVQKDVNDLTVIGHAQYKRKEAVEFAKKISTFLEAQVMEEMTTAVNSADPTKASYVKFSALLDLLSSFTTRGSSNLAEGRLFEAWITDMSQGNRLVSNLVTQLEALALEQTHTPIAQKVANQAATSLKFAAPGFEGRRKASDGFFAGINGTFNPHPPGMPGSGGGCQGPISGGPGT